MTAEEAALFVIFQKNYDSIAFMIAQGVFDIKQGSATLSFDSEGTLLAIEKKSVVHRPKHPPISPRPLGVL